MLEKEGGPHLSISTEHFCIVSLHKQMVHHVGDPRYDSKIAIMGAAQRFHSRVVLVVKKQPNQAQVKIRSALCIEYTRLADRRVNEELEEIEKGVDRSVYF